MKLRKKAAVIFLAAVIFFTQTILVFAENTSVKNTPDNLYSLSAVLMDGESGRVLYGKESDKPRPNASTTKVLTCILALENASGDDYVSVSQNAASQPEVKLGIKKGEQYHMEDLLYSLMLRSHNDSAVAIAEHISGSVEAFGRLMNAKAKEIGCKNTHFITPNGLDAKDKEGVHETTATDLALIMRYAIKNPVFLHITQTRDYSFSEISGKRQFSIHNANAFLDMGQGCISGKTGFTGNAGYCYVCACEKNGKLFIIALLGCGWPNNKTYKWSDAKKLLKYGDENFEYHKYWKEPGWEDVLVKNAVPETGILGDEVYLKGMCYVKKEIKEKKILLQEGESAKYQINMSKEIMAPVKKGRKIGEISIYFENTILYKIPILAEKNIEKISYYWVVNKVFNDFFS